MYQEFLDVKENGLFITASQGHLHLMKRLLPGLKALDMKLL